MIFIGVAGSVDENCHIGDIVISEKLYQHDMDARPIFDKYIIPLTGEAMFAADRYLINVVRKVCEKFLEKISDNIPPLLLSEFNIISPKCKVGLLASGDRFISDQSEFMRLKEDHPEVLAVEMEGAAFAQVCNDYEVPFVVIRTISDNADHTADIDFTKFIQCITQIYSQHIIREILVQDIYTQ